MVGKGGNKGGAKNTTVGDDSPGGVNAAENQPIAAFQEDLQDMAVSMRDFIIETNAGLSEGLTNSIIGPLQKMKESHADLPKTMKDMIVLLNDKLTPVASVAAGNISNNDPPKMPGPQGFILSGYQASSSNSPAQPPWGKKVILLER